MNARKYLYDLIKIRIKKIEKRKREVLLKLIRSTLNISRLKTISFSFIFLN